MVRPYGIDLRQRVVEAIDAGLSARSAAARFLVVPSSAIKWHQQWRAEGSLEPAGQNQPPSSKLDAHEAFILGLVAIRKDITLHEIAEHLKTEHSAEQVRPDVQARRQDWFDGQTELDPDRLIFIDETGANTKMVRLRGRSTKGERCRAPILHGHCRTQTFTAGLEAIGRGRADASGWGAPCMAPPSWPVLSMCWCRTCVRVTSWSWTTWPRTRLPGRAR
jgi:transposase